MKKPKIIFLRADDICRPDLKFKKVFDFLAENEIPANYAAIPGKTTSALSDFVRKRSAPAKLVNFIQHGWKHINHCAEPGGARYEFGPARVKKQQKHDISRGLDRMHTMFRELFAPAFVPPFHVYDATTVRLCAEMEFGVFAAGKKLFPLPDSKMIYLPFTVALSEYGNDLRPRPLPLERMIAATELRLRESSVAGVRFHHDAFFGRHLDDFMRYCRFLKKLEAAGAVKFALISDVIARNS